MYDALEDDETLLRRYGVVGDGEHDDADGVQRMVDDGYLHVLVRAKRVYTMTQTISMERRGSDDGG